MFQADTYPSTVHGETAENLVPLVTPLLHWVARFENISTSVRLLTLPKN